MNRHIAKLNQEQIEQASSHRQTSRNEEALEFATADELIRHDAKRNAPSPAVAARLQESIAREPRPARPWWQRWRGQPG
jgi:hypothetical protein